ncbi:VCBS repeat-containing protein, partial [Candidatus Uhrbacteria bacterium]|nr:VCBS repeat-containing protein [Candidatus Uhrbacteria bacterium]
MLKKQFSFLALVFAVVFYGSFFAVSGAKATRLGPELQFDPYASYGLWGRPKQTVIYDINKDGHNDVLAANERELTVHLGDGTGALAPFFIALPAISLNFFKLIDINKDENIDVFLKPIGSSVGWALGNGDGTFSNPSLIYSYSSIDKIVVGDYNNDQKDDAVGSSPDDNIGEFFLFISNGVGGFTSKRFLPPGKGTLGVDDGDLNEDGKLDLVFANYYSNNITVMLGTGGGPDYFSPLGTFPVGLTPASVALSDFNEDGHLDAAVANLGSGTMSVLLGNGDGTFGSATTYAAGDIITTISDPDVKAADLNGDSHLDLVMTGHVVINGQGYGKLFTFLGDGTGLFRNAVIFSNDPASGVFAVGNLDEAGNPEIVTPHSIGDTAKVNVFINRTTGFPPETDITSYPPSLINSGEASFEFFATESNSTFECSLDGGGFASCVSPKAYAGLLDGTHLFEVRATDISGDTDPTPASYSWTIDITPPETTIASGPNSPTNSTSASLSF